MGDPDIIPLNLRNAIIEPEKVIAPTEAPIDISIKLASLISPGMPKPKTFGLRNADIATKTAAKPLNCENQQQQLWHSSHRNFKSDIRTNGTTNY